MADRVFMPRAFDEDGNIVVDALAYFFANGTSTPITVYTDTGATTPHASPVEADGDGVFPAVYTTQSVKLSLRDGAGADLPGFPSNDWHITPTVGTAAELVSFSPVTGNPETDVQAAIEANTTVLNALTTYGKGLAATVDAADARAELGLGAAATYEVSNAGGLALERTTHLTTEFAVKTYADSVADAQNGWAYVSGEQAITGAATLTLTHGLGARPTKFSFVLRCKITEHNYSVGDEIEIAACMDDVGSTVRGPVCVVDAGSTTQFKVLIPDSFIVVDKTTYGRAAATTANWRLIARASL